MTSDWLQAAWRHADRREDVGGEDDHARRCEGVGLHRQREGEDPGPAARVGTWGVGEEKPIECGSDEHTGMVGAVAMGLLLYVCGIYLTFGYATYVAPSSFSDLGFRAPRWERQFERRAGRVEASLADLQLLLLATGGLAAGDGRPAPSSATSATRQRSTATRTSTRVPAGGCLKDGARKNPQKYYAQ
jgi:hypothetical protein